MDFRSSLNCASIVGLPSLLSVTMLKNLQTAPIQYVGGIPFRSTNLSEVRQWLLTVAVPQRVGLNVRLANAYNVALASKDPAYATLLSTAGVNFPDGTPVAWFMKLQGSHGRPGRVRGPSLFSSTLKESVELGTRHYFLGSTVETLRRLEENVRTLYPGIVIAGSYSPPFTSIDEAYISDCANRIRESEATLVWVGLGTPKQDVLGTALAREVNVVSVNVGAAFDFLAGTVREAPLWVQRSGFEWLFRLASEPKRLWRRYLIGNIQFLVAAVRNFSRDTTRIPS